METLTFKVEEITLRVLDIFLKLFSLLEEILTY